MVGTTLWHDHAHSWLHTEPQPPSLQSDLLIESVASLVSTGTERLVVRGALPEDATRKMSVPYMQGTFTTSFTYGYSLVGRVVGAASAYTSLKNSLVHVMHPHATHASVSAESVTVLPSSLDTKQSLLISSMETVVNACWDADIVMGDRVVIFGFGLIGNLLAAVIGRMPGVTVVIAEQDQQRAAIAQQAGFNLMPEAELDEFDIAFNTTANQAALQQAIDLTTTDGRIVELSWYGERAVSLQLGSAFHHGRKRIISSQVSVIPAHLGTRHNYASRKALCIRLLQDPAITLAEPNWQSLPFDQAPAHFNALREQQHNLPAIILEY